MKPKRKPRHPRKPKAKFIRTWTKWGWTIGTCDDRIGWLTNKLQRVVSPRRRSMYERQLRFAQSHRAEIILTK